MRARALVAVLLLGGCAARAQPPASPPEPEPASEISPPDAPIVIRRSIVAAEYFWLRAKMLERDAPPAFAEALAALLALKEDLAADPTAWEDFEVPLGTARRAADLVEAYRRLPASRLVGAKSVPLRARGMRLAQALADAEAAYRDGPYREHSGEITRAASELSRLLVPRMETILHAVEGDMGLPESPRRIELTLVADAPFQGAFAADERGLLAASFVRVRGVEGSALVETVLFETLHAIDELTVRSPTAMNMLRGALSRRGLSEEDVEMVVTAVTSAEAASLVQRFVVPSHRALGEDGLYALWPPAPAVVAAWNRHLEGESIDETTDAIARAVVVEP